MKPNLKTDVAREPVMQRNAYILNSIILYFDSLVIIFLYL